MTKHKKLRCCRRINGDTVFKPRSQPFHSLETVDLPLDQLEAMRLCDLEGLDQATAGERMCVSRGTIQRLLQEGRRTLVGAIVHGQALQIHQDEEEFVDESMRPFCGQPRSRCCDA